MARPKNALPTYRLHKQSGQAIVTVSTGGVRKDILLGKYGTPESKQEYERVLARLRLAGPALPAEDLTVAELLLRFMAHAQTHYRHPDGRPTYEVYNFKLSLRPVRELYAATPAADFGPLALKTVRSRMVELGWCRSQINIRIGRVRRVWKWAASEELVPPAAYTSLTTVTGLQKGRSDAAERAPVGPAPVDHVVRAMVEMNRQVRGLVEFQRLTGCRPGEATRLRRCDVDQSGPVWVYRPSGYKTAWRGKARAVLIGPQAQALLAGFPTDDPAAFVFSPAAAAREHHAARAAARKTPLYRSHAARNASVRVSAPKRAAGEHYTLDSYGQAIDRACDRAGVAHWHPNQLRHSFATEVRKAYGLEAAQVLLGHERADVTQVYAEKNLDLARRVAAAIG